MSIVVAPSQNWFRRALTLVGIVLVLWDLVSRIHRGVVDTWVVVCILAAVVAWIAFVVAVPFRRVATIALAVMIAGGGLAATSTDAVGLVPVIIAVLWIARDLARPLWLAAILVLAGMLIVVVGDVLQPYAWLGLLSMEAGLVVAFFGGLSRRQFLIAEARSRELIGEQARADVLDARQQIAHDIHDVLAHSLGGLVIQLDAVDALLEAGDTKAAASRVRDSRVLAAEGLNEARRAVAALGQVPATGEVDGVELAQGLAALVTAHRSLGGLIDFDERGSRESVSAPLAVALRRALQEGLTNARKHAPGEPVTAELAWKSGSVQLSLSNPLVGASTDATGGGHGLVGMRERFAALPGGSATAGPESGSFVVRVEAATA